MGCSVTFILLVKMRFCVHMFKEQCKGGIYLYRGILCKKKKCKISFIFMCACHERESAWVIVVFIIRVGSLGLIYKKRETFHAWLM